MSEPERPTLPPPRRRQDRRDTPPDSVPSDARELLLRELKAAEDRGREERETALAELVEVFERQLSERDETIRVLQRADTEAVLAQANLQEALLATIASRVTIEVQKQLRSVASAEGAEAGSVTGKAAGSRAGARWTPLAGFVGAVIAAAVSAGAQRCSADDDKPAVPTYQPRR